MINNVFEFDEELFNTLFFEIWEDFQDESIRHIYVQGGSSAGKTYTLSQADVIAAMQGENTAVFRKVGRDMQDNIYGDFKSIIEQDWQLSDYFKLNVSPLKVVCNQSEGLIRFKGLDEPGKVKGLSTMKRIHLNEADQFDYADVKELRRRLRGKKGQQIIYEWNPVSEEHWLKTEIFDKGNFEKVETNLKAKWRNKNSVWYQTTYLDNRWIVGDEKSGIQKDIHTIAEFEDMKEKDANDYNVYGLGEWGTLRKGR